MYKPRFGRDEKDLHAVMCAWFSFLNAFLMRCLNLNRRRATYSTIPVRRPWHVSLPVPFHTAGFRVKLDDGTQSFLRDVSRSMLETALPEEAEDLRAACESSAAGGTSGDASRSIMETANRLAQLKNGVLEPMLCQVLTQQVVG